MKHSILLFIFFALFSTLSAQFNYNNGGNKIKGNGTVATETRAASSFTGIDVGTSIRVELTQSKNHSIEVEAEENILPYVITEISGRELNIYFKKGVSIKANKPIIVHVSMADLQEIDAGSASSVTTTSSFKGADLEIECGSSAQVEIEFEGNFVSADVGSAGRVELRGSANSVDLEVSSAGVIDAGDFKAKTAKVEANSAGSMSVYASDRLDADASSAASIRYKGNPEKVFTDSSSAGRISKSNF
jgi:hypothetical protein